MRYEEVNGFDIVKFRFKMLINFFIIGVFVVLEYFCVNCILIGVKGR